MSDAQQKALEETSKVALDAADAATRAAEEIHGVKKEYEGLLKSNRGVLRGLSIALVSTAVGLLVAVGASALVYYKSRAQFEKSDEMLLQAVAVFAENVDELTLAQTNLNSLIETQNDLRNEIGLARKSLDTVPAKIDETLTTLLPKVSSAVDASQAAIEESVTATTELAMADLSQKFTVVFDEVEAISALLERAISDATSSAEVNTTEPNEDTDTSAYELVNVQSDLEQIILLQKELSAKITLLQDISKPRNKVVTKRTTNTTKKQSTKPANPLKFP
ncbi:hypothetical protein HIMB11_03070 [Rhodobacteraceae bacterium HIMB11]|nr:hypothetical protein HIMB11_03070 [Rhodobacteraceae bacterium HIMB11]